MKDNAHVYSAIIFLIVMGFIGYECFKTAERVTDGIQIQFKTMEDILNGNS